ncbi:MAG: pteridine reductase [Gammaproteobacteria bacterium]
MKTIPKKIALITGAARRIGAEIAGYLHNKDINVVIHYHHSQAEAKQLCQTLNKKRANSACALAADLNDTQQISLLAKQAIAHWGRLDVLVNNASTFFSTDFHTATASQWDQCFNTNLKAPFFLSQALADSLKKHAGCIVNIADIHALKPLHHYSFYSMAKAGLVMMTQSLAKTLAPEIRVNAIAPGSTLWPEGDNQLNDHAKTKIIAKIPLQQQGSPTHIAHTVDFLIENSHITGQVITVDGGRSIK